MIPNHDFVTIPASDGTELDAYIAIPTGMDSKSPGILLFQEAFGVNSHMRNIAERLCSDGYAVIAPDLFHRSERRVEIPYTDFSAAKPHLSALTKEGLYADSQAAYQWFQNHENVLPDSIASLGFCMGGRVSFLANTWFPLLAGVSYYGGGLDALAGEAEKLNSTQLFFWGGKDQSITPEKIDTIIGAVKNAGKNYISTVISYAGHGFNCDERESYNAEAASESWSLTLAFLSNKLNIAES